MSRVSWGAGALSVVFLFACMGGEAPKPSPAPAAPAPAAPAPAAEPAGEGGEATPDGEKTEDGAKEGEGGEGTAEATDDGESWCCEYDGPLGKTHALLDSPKECTDKFGSNGAEFVKGPQCEAVCCKYAEDPADLGKGHLHEVVAKANCEMRKGETVEPTAEVCAELMPEGAEDDKPAAKPRPRPPPRGPMVRPGSAPVAPRGNGGGGGTRLQPKPGGLTRPGG
ncbi:MAG: hypothetical protein H6737_17420 [Alphaproteobacteria bacterium]|nr:hypothetical protein [Alphaproteobacteria bacterium]